ACRFRHWGRPTPLYRVVNLESQARLTRKTDAASSADHDTQHLPWCLVPRKSFYHLSRVATRAGEIDGTVEGVGYACDDRSRFVAGGAFARAHRFLGVTRQLPDTEATRRSADWTRAVRADGLSTVRDL